MAVVSGRWTAAAGGGELVWPAAGSPCGRWQEGARPVAAGQGARPAVVGQGALVVARTWEAVGDGRAASSSEQDGGFSGGGVGARIGKLGFPVRVRG
ncbi:hypothetical protein GUJ93_ZPchr0002g24531 [Zizania palustris]|uniref:Uncharacterized protein n=1 Tax=Zizania palustris TaxID=103762 RepID=A0A8J5VE78_ZIZPA|nr:hypothetical protein GUJ93_ZPchr0002g24531 [Zizania palustris]